MITMRIMAVKLPMMIPMTRDMVGDIPDNAKLHNRVFLVFFRSPWSVFIIVIGEGGARE